MPGAWGKSWGVAFGAAWGSVEKPVQSGAFVMPGMGRATRKLVPNIKPDRTRLRRNRDAILAMFVLR